MTNLALLGAISTWTKPLWVVVIAAALAAVALLAAALLLQLIAPKVSAIARGTAKEALYQPFFYVLLTVGVLAMLFFPFIPYSTFGEDVKVLKDGGLTLAMVLSILLGVWTASTSIADEIEGRTALTLLSKPINRRQFILGKFLGILGPVMIMFLVLGALFLVSVSYKVVYDARETAQLEPTSADCQREMVQIMPGLALAMMETTVLTAISVAIATRLPMLANLIICASIYALGHLLPVLVESGSRQFEMVDFVARLLATILPGLESFNIYTAISTGQEVPLAYLGWAGLYCLLYTTVAMLVALLLFEDRDLA